MTSFDTHGRTSPTDSSIRHQALSSHRLRLSRRERTGIAQLSLAEHSLCALDSSVSLVANYRHQTGYFYTDATRDRKFATVSISAPLGLSSRDEYFLWGLLAITFNQPDPSIELLATPHYLLRKLGILSERSGGKNYADFRASIKRLAGVFYQSDAFYDPRLQTFQDVGFGFLKYSLPQEESSRAWRIVWDPLFFEYVQATGGKLFFDLTAKAFRNLDPASRRLGLLLHKVFWRKSHSPAYDVRHLAVHVLGFSPSIDTKRLKYKISRCAEKLLDNGFIAPPASNVEVAGLFEKRGKGHYIVRFHRGPYFEQASIDDLAHRPRTNVIDSPLYDPLRAIGFEDSSIGAIVRMYDHRTISRWAQYTQAAMESKGPRFFKKSPQAFCLDGIKRGSSAPDWYLEQQRAELLRQQDEELRSRPEGNDGTTAASYQRAKARARAQYIHEHVSREHYQKTVEVFLQLFAKQMPESVAEERAITEAEQHLTAGFQFPAFESWSVSSTVGHDDAHHPGEHVDSA